MKAPIACSLEESNEVSCLQVAVCFDNFFCDVLSHARQALKSGGIVPFTCPNGKGFDTDMLQEAAPAVDTEHDNLFNPEPISFLSRRAGFEMVSIETPGRLDVDIVRRAFLSNQTHLDKTPFWKTLFVNRFEDLGTKFQSSLIENRLSGNMRVFAQK